MIRYDAQLKQAIRSSEIFQRIQELFYFFRQMGIVPVWFFLSVICSFFSVFFNLFGLKLLMSLLQGMIRGGDFASVGDKWGVLRRLSAFLPQDFVHSHFYLVVLLAVILFSVVMKNLLDYVASLGVDHQIRKADSNIRKIVLNRYLSFGKLYFDRVNASTIAQEIINASQGVVGQLRPLQRMLSQTLSLAAYLLVMFWISWKLTIFAILVFPASSWAVRGLVRRIKGAVREHELSQYDLLARVMNATTCISLVKAYGTEESEKRALAQASDREIRLGFQVQKKEQLLRPLEDIRIMTALLLMVLVMVFVAPIQGPNAVSLSLVFFFVMRLSMRHFGAFADFTMSLGRAAGQIQSLSDLLLSDEGKFRVLGGEGIFGGVQQNIEFRNLSFYYRNKHLVLHQVSFIVEKGKTTAIVGPTGAGKTTLLHLLMRFYDCPPGAIFLDGRDIREYSIKSLVDQIAFVSQEPVLFNGTLKQNILYGIERPVGDKELWGAIEKAELGDWIRSLPEGWETVAGDRGVQLSGGERQRVSIARAFLKNASILILDEATSALDTKTERNIQEVLGQASSERTVLVVAHRLSTILNADKIVVLEKGRVVEEGSLEELLSKKGRFHEYWEAQNYSMVPSEVSS